MLGRQPVRKAHFNRFVLRHCAAANEQAGSRQGDAAKWDGKGVLEFHAFCLLGWGGRGAISAARYDPLERALVGKVLLILYIFALKYNNWLRHINDGQNSTPDAEQKRSKRNSPRLHRQRRAGRPVPH